MNHIWFMLMWSHDFIISMVALKRAVGLWWKMSMLVNKDYSMINRGDSMKLWFFCNVYTPNKSSDRILFFDNLKNKIPNNHNVILGGNFNCYENPELDRTLPLNHTNTGYTGSRQLRDLANTLQSVRRSRYESSEVNFSFTWKWQFRLFPIAHVSGMIGNVTNRRL